jgi:hypothetical protein
MGASARMIALYSYYKEKAFVRARRWVTVRALSLAFAIRDSQSKIENSQGA